MLNLELIDDLYASLPKERQKELITKLFNKSKQSMGYFHRTKDISLSKLEVLADFFGMPLDYFRQGSGFRIQNSQTNADGTTSVNMGLMMENKSLNMQLESMKTIIAAKDETVKAQNAVIQLLRAQMNNSVSRDSGRGTIRDSDDGYYCI